MGRCTSGRWEIGKVKRIRRCGQVKVAPCDQRGKLLGPAVDAEAQVHPKGSPMYEHGNRLMDQKYGLLKKMFGFMGRKDDDQRVIIEIKTLSRSTLP